MKISFIIPAFNEEKYLDGCIESIIDSANGVVKDYEIIVVNNSSTDNTVEVAKKKKCIVFNQTERNIGKTRNLGAKKAKGKYLIFIDADSKLTKKLFIESMTKITKPTIFAISTMTTFDNYPNLTSYGVWIYNILSYLFRLGIGQFILIEKSTFEKINGFDERNYAFEEIDFFRRIKRFYGFKSVCILRSPIISSSRKFENGKTNVVQFLYLLFLSIIGFDSGRDKKRLGFWYGRV